MDAMIYEQGGGLGRNGWGWQVTPQKVRHVNLLLVFGSNTLLTEHPTWRLEGTRKSDFKLLDLLVVDFKLLL